MRCPFCGDPEDKVIDSRASQDGDNIRRRRECLACSRRFTTYERIEKMPLKVVKRDNTRDDFDRGKILSGIIRSCEKRPVGMDVIEKTVTEIEKLIEMNYEHEVSSQAIGEFVMQKLQALDHVAYVRYASVYRQFKDINQFVTEIKILFEKMGDQAKLAELLDEHTSKDS